MPIFPINEPFNPLMAVQGPKGKEIDQEKLRKACADFESIFIRQLLKSMRQTVFKGGLFREGIDTEIYQSLFDQELSKSLSSQGRLGLGAMIYRQILEQEDRKRVIPGELKALEPLRNTVSKETED